MILFNLPVGLGPSDLLGLFFGATPPAGLAAPPGRALRACGGRPEANRFARGACPCRPCPAGAAPICAREQGPNRIRKRPAAAPLAERRRDRRKRSDRRADRLTAPPPAPA
ncbi:hypothetical protein, partial [Amaricoccus sp.]|uniref:hypothetical protein n=1 Tax=Amaricoccus sp. TaxID=1872485 RepID=UPI001B469B91